MHGLDLDLEKLNTRTVNEFKLDKRSNRDGGLTVLPCQVTYCLSTSGVVLAGWTAPGRVGLLMGLLDLLSSWAHGVAGKMCSLSGEKLRT